MTLLPALAILLASNAAPALSERLDADAKAGRPLVAHVVVGLCDNATQGISPVPAKLGDGKNPSTNLYWGAAYGVRTHLPKAGWKAVAHAGALPDGVLERRVFHAKLRRGSGGVDVYVVADAYDGTRLPFALGRFGAFAAGEKSEVALSGGQPLPAGGAAHLVAFVGHNGLMDSTVPAQSGEAKPARGSAVLACLSRSWFDARLRSAGTEPVLLTNGLMAPEGYVVDGLLRAFFEGRDPEREAAGEYARYQKISERAARRLFQSPTR